MQHYGNPSGTELKEVMGVKIYVDGNGIFRARVGARGDIMERKDLKALEKEILKQLAGADALRIAWGEVCQRTKVIEYIKGSNQFRMENRSLEAAYHFFRYDAAAFAQFADIERDRKALQTEFEERKNALRDRFEAVKKGLIQLTPEDLKAAKPPPAAEENKDLRQVSFANAVRNPEDGFGPDNPAT